MVVIAASLLAAGCSSFSNRGEVDKPYIEAANTYQFSFENVALTDSSTVVTAMYGRGPARPYSLTVRLRLLPEARNIPLSRLIISALVNRM